MSFINWSDPEEMLGLLAEYVADEWLAEQDDRHRHEFLNELSTALTALASAEELSTGAAIDRLRAICDSQPAEFVSDPVLAHVDDCIQELERIASASNASPVRR